MSNKYSSILSDYEPLTKLNKSELKLFHFLIKNSRQSPFHYSNEYLAEILGRRVETVSKYISHLKELKLINVEYVPHRNGTKRIIKLPNKNNG